MYTGLYEYNNEQLTIILEDCNILSTEWAYRLKERNRPVLFVGQDVEIHREAISQVLGDLAFFAPNPLSNPRPSELAFIGKDKMEEDIHHFVPNYVRMAEAEANGLNSSNRIQMIRKATD